VIYPYFQHVAQTMRNMEIYVRQREKERLAALGEMAAGLAHEIRNPLGAIKGAAQFLDPSGDRPDSRFLKIIIDETDRLNQVVTQFLDYSKPPNLDFKQIDLSTLVSKTVETLRPGLAAQGAKLKLEFTPARGEALVMGVPEQIQQVLLNLVQNAIKALHGKADGLIHVSVETEGHGQSKEVSATVFDNGCGIKREHLDKLFIPFFTTSPSGTGLGLSISHKIVETHRGRIEVSSEEGRFTRFAVVLPHANIGATGAGRD
jgi:signal transduction histidine kinase